MKNGVKWSSTANIKLEVIGLQRYRLFMDLKVQKECFGANRITRKQRFQDTDNSFSISFQFCMGGKYVVSVKEHGRNVLKYLGQ